ISCFAEAQEIQKGESALSPYISSSSPSYYFNKLQWFNVKPDAGFISLRKLKGYLPPYDSTKTPQYVSKSALPYFSEQPCFILCEGSIWKDSVKTADERRKVYGKR